MKSLMCMFESGASYKKYKYWCVKSGWGEYKAKHGQLWGGKNSQFGTQLSSQFICVSHPTVCDINRISNLAVNYFYVVNICSHFHMYLLQLEIIASWSLKCFQLYHSDQGSSKKFSNTCLFYHFKQSITHPIYLH